MVENWSLIRCVRCKRCEWTGETLISQVTHHLVISLGWSCPICGLNQVTTLRLTDDVAATIDRLWGNSGFSIGHHVTDPGTVLHWIMARINQLPQPYKSNFQEWLRANYGERDLASLSPGELEGVGLLLAETERYFGNKNKSQPVAE